METKIQVGKVLSSGLGRGIFLSGSVGAQIPMAGRGRGALGNIAVVSPSPPRPGRAGQGDMPKLMDIEECVGGTNPPG